MKVNSLTVRVRLLVTVAHHCDEVEDRDEVDEEKTEERMEKNLKNNNHYSIPTPDYNTDPWFTSN